MNKRFTVTRLLSVKVVPVMLPFSLEHFPVSLGYLVKVFPESDGLHDDMGQCDSGRNKNQVKHVGK